MLSKSQHLKVYEDMLLIRRFEERAGQLYGQGVIGGFCHLYIGQEAIVVGMQGVTTPKDTVITAYRDHGHMLACGMNPDFVMAELTGRRSGYSKGKGGSMHMFSREKNFFGGHGIVGAQTSIGTGLAFAHAYTKDGGLTFCYMGDGAANQGQFFESMNMASLWKLPIIYIIEDNRYSMGTSTTRHAAGQGFHIRGSIFDIPGTQVDGMDVLKVYEAGKKATEHVRQGQGPYLLVMDCYRYRGHSMSDPGKYRSKEEVDSVKQTRDPLMLFKTYLLAQKTATEEDFKSMEQKIKTINQEAARFALDDPEPPEDELYKDILIGDEPCRS